jgi:hypothetical protein
MNYMKYNGDAPEELAQKAWIKEELHFRENFG